MSFYRHLTSGIAFPYNVATGTQELDSVQTPELIKMYGLSRGQLQSGGPEQISPLRFHLSLSRM